MQLISALFRIILQTWKILHMVIPEDHGVEGEDVMVDLCEGGML